jgi:branched-subunit amino acid transport protein
MTAWLLIFVLSVVTFANRYVFFSKVITYHPGEKITKFLGFSTQSILTALWVPIVFSYNEASGVNYVDKNYLIAGGVVFLLSILKVNIFITIILGSTLFFILKFN